MRIFCRTVLVSICFCATAPAVPELRNGVAAIVNEAIITFQDIEEYVQVPMVAALRTHIGTRAEFEQKRAEIMDSGLTNLVEKHLILQDFKAGGFPVPESLIEDEIQNIIRRRYGDRVTMTKSLQAEGIRQEAFRQRVYDDMVLQYMRQKNVSQAIIISPKKIEGYYTNNFTKFRLDDQVKLRMIVLNTTSSSAEEVRRLGGEIITKLDEGAAFAEMAAVYSEGSQRSEGGDWGWRERSYLRKGLSDIAFNLNPGQRSGLVGLGKGADDGYIIYLYDKTGQLAVTREYSGKETLVAEKKAAEAAGEGPSEFYLMLVEDKRLAHVRPLEQVREEIEKELLVQERNRLQRQWVERLRAKAFVRYFR